MGYALGAVVVLAVVYLLAPSLLFSSPELRIGEVVERDFKSPAHLDVLDLETMQRIRDQAEAEVPVVYDLDPEAAEVLDRKMAAAFSVARDERARPGRPILKGQTVPSDRGFQEPLDIRLSRSTMIYLQTVGYEETFETEVRQYLQSFMGNGIIPSRVFVAGEKERGIVIRVLGEREEQFIKNVRSIPDLTEVRLLAVESVTQAVSQAAPDEAARATAAGELVSKLLVPNITYNKMETQSRREAAREAVKPLYYKVKKGDLIFRAGERVADEDRPVLDELAKHQSTGFVFRILLGLAIMVGAVLTIFYFDIRRYRFPLTRDLPKLFLLGILLVGTIALSKFFYFLLIGFADQFPAIAPSSVIYAIPVTLGAMLITLLFDTHMGLIFSFIVSLLMGIAMPEEPFYPIYSFVGSVVGVFSVIYCHRRTQLLRAGLMVSMVNLIMVGGIDLYKGTDLGFMGLYDLCFAAAGGLLAGLIVSGVLPVLEYLFTVTTDIRLLELLDLNHPLLRRLSTQAPGTYYHSMMVSNLAEAATGAVGENPLLARVCCYYHDIGKMARPEYFIENQSEAGSLHDKITPQASCLILASHVLEGMELAREHKLPQAIVDSIPQHHGTRLMTYFYDRAQKGRPPDQPPLPEADFRYPGPRPQSKCAAIIMLADAVEAASRVLNNPTRERIAALVEKLVTAIYVDGQLIESDLTFKDLKTIQESFVKVLTGQFHQRIEYPGLGLPDYGEAGHHDPDRKPAAQHPAAAGKLQDISRKGPSQAGAA